tara:strand:+ start:75 stop:179 length:105 start_codon:yes stop_codon:yes gene_type:complete
MLKTKTKGIADKKIQFERNFPEDLEMQDDDILIT